LDVDGVNNIWGPQKNINKGRCIYIKYIKSYQEDVVRQKYEVIPGTFDPIFKKIFKSVKEFLADIIYEVYKKLDDLSKDKYYALLYDEEEKKAYENKCILEDAIEDSYSSGLNHGVSNEKINITKNMLKKNMPIEDISDVTGLTIEKINNLRENI